jgi:hypothetical protein
MWKFQLFLHDLAQMPFGEMFHFYSNKNLIGLQHMISALTNILAYTEGNYELNTDFILICNYAYINQHFVVILTWYFKPSRQIQCSGNDISFASSRFSLQNNYYCTKLAACPGNSRNVNIFLSVFLAPKLIIGLIIWHFGLSLNIIEKI